MPSSLPRFSASVGFGIISLIRRTHSCVMSSSERFGATWMLPLETSTVYPADTGSPFTSIKPPSSIVIDCALNEAVENTASSVVMSSAPPAIIAIDPLIKVLAGTFKDPRLTTTSPVPRQSLNSTLPPFCTSTVALPKPVMGPENTSSIPSARNVVPSPSPLSVIASVSVQPHEPVIVPSPYILPIATAQDAYSPKSIVPLPERTSNARLACLAVTPLTSKVPPATLTATEDESWQRETIVLEARNSPVTFTVPEPVHSPNTTPLALCFMALYACEASFESNGDEVLIARVPPMSIPNDGLSFLSPSESALSEASAPVGIESDPCCTLSFPPVKVSDGKRSVPPFCA